MDNEIQSLQSNETLTLTDPPTDRSIVQRKWHYKVKGDPDQPTFKARYIAKGYSQIPETEDNIKTFPEISEPLKEFISDTENNEVLLENDDDEFIQFLANETRNPKINVSMSQLEQQPEITKMRTKRGTQGIKNQLVLVLSVKSPRLDSNVI